MIAGAESLVRCAPGEDGTNGFFVSMFVRSQTGDNVHGAAGSREQFAVALANHVGVLHCAAVGPGYFGPGSWVI